MTDNLNTTTMTYEGSVDVSLKINGKVYKLNGHNGGTSYLKYVFAKAMMNDLDRWNTPGYVSLVRVTEAGEEQMYLVKDIAISGSQLVDEVGDYPVAVTFTAYIQYEDLIEPVDAASVDTFYLYLISHDDETQLGIRHKMARFRIKAGVLSYITPGTTATLNWTLRIVNRGEE